MRASVTITLPADLCELATAETLRKAQYIYYAYMVKDKTVRVSYNANKITTAEIFKYISKNKTIKEIQHDNLYSTV